MLIELCLMVLFAITLLSIMSGGSFTSGITENAIYNEIIINGTTTTVEYGDANLTFAIDPLIGGLVMLTIVVTIAILLGIRAVGSGLADTSIATIRTAIMYLGIWITLSLTSAPLIESITTIGSVIYISLTIFYIIGVFQKITGGGGGGGDGF